MNLAPPGARGVAPLVVAVGFGHALLLPSAARSQSLPDSAGAQAATAALDTIIVQREDLFTTEAAAANPFLALFNDLHATTKPWVIRRELLLHPGMPYDSSLAAESERNLRALGIFRSVRVDTARVDGRPALLVRTKDAWSLQPRATARVASDGTLTGSLGVTETNFAGTGNAVRLWYVRQADRDGIITAGTVRRIGGSRMAISGGWSNLSDRSSGRWSVSNPFLSFSDRWSIFYGGEAFSGRVLQFRVPDAAVRDTTEWRRRAFVNRAFITVAPLASAREYVRVGASFEVRQEKHFLVENPAIDPDTALSMVPDTVTGLVGGFVEYRRARYRRVRHFNGFTEEDQDLSDLFFLSVKLAPDGFGYESTGVGTRVVLGSGVSAGPVILKGVLDGNALFNAAGLDSGRVVGTGTVAVRSGPRNATFVQVSGGVLDSPPPGGEFDIGFETLPRLWGPHAFVGTRSVRATLEHRYYAIDDLLGILGLGFSGYVDYGGAWYRDQGARLGGDVGIALFLGSPLGSLAQVVHLSGGYRFGGGVVAEGDSRWALALGSGIIF